MTFSAFHKPGNIKPATADLATELGRLMKLAATRPNSARVLLLWRIYSNMTAEAKARCDLARGQS